MKVRFENLKSPHPSTLDTFDFFRIIWFDTYAEFGYKFVFMNYQMSFTIEKD